MICMSRAAAPTLLLAAAVAVGGCSGVRDAFGTDAAAGRQAAHDLLTVVGQRFGPTRSSDEHGTTRDLLLKHSFSPSPLMEASFWHDRRGPLRRVGFVGAPAGTHYHFGLAAQPPALSSLASARVEMKLTDAGGGAFVWERRDELATGHFGGESASAGWSALLRALEGAAARREDAGLLLRRELPRARQALGRALTLHALDARREGDTTAVSLALELSTASLSATHPRYARFLETYVPPMQAHARGEDAAGRAFFEAEAERMRLMLRFRVRDGRLVTLAAPHAPVGSPFRLVMGFSTKSGLFRVGVDDLSARGEVAAGPRARLDLAFREKPRWRLPFFVKPFLRGPLDHSFTGEGSRLRFAFAPLPAGGHEVWRDYRFPVRETWVTRFVGSMASGTVQDFRNGAEPEADAFVREAFFALRDDLLALP